MKIVWAILSSSLLIGCSSYESRTYEVSVQNLSRKPITLWLTKDCEPFEDGWLSPEDLAMETPKNRDFVVSGVMVPPGKTADTGPRTGKFEKFGSAVLRIYDGKLKFNEILAVGRDSPLRIDLALPEGASEWTVTRDSKGLLLVELSEPQTSP